MSTIPGLYVLGEANFSDHGANRLGASALMQGLADGYFVIPYTIGDYFGNTKLDKLDTSHPEFTKVKQEVNDRTKRLLSLRGKRTVDSLHRGLGLLCREKCGMGRNEKQLKEALAAIPGIREEFWKNAMVPGSGNDLNQTLERAGRVADFLEFAELMVADALERRESCGGHFREESQTEEGEAKRDDESYSHAAVWEYQGEGKAPLPHKEPFTFEYAKPAQRSYK